MTAPRDRWDCHTHVFGPYQRFPLATGRAYTPPEADRAALVEHLDRLGIERVVLVQAHSYGTDPAAMTDALAALGDRARAVTVVDLEQSSGEELSALHTDGVRGIRINVHTAGDAERTVTGAIDERAVHLLNGSGLHLQLFAAGDVLMKVVPQVATAAPVKIVVDHMGMALCAGDDGLDVVRMLTEHDCWIKLSAPERMGLSPDDPKVRRLVEAFAEQAPDRIVWGSDWPHSGLWHTRPVEETEPFRDVDDRDRLTTLQRWLGPELFDRMLCDNAEALYA